MGRARKLRGAGCNKAFCRPTIPSHRSGSVIGLATPPDAGTRHTLPRTTTGRSEVDPVALSRPGGKASGTCQVPWRSTSCIDDVYARAASVFVSRVVRDLEAVRRPLRPAHRPSGCFDDASGTGTINVGHPELITPAAPVGHEHDAPAVRRKLRIHLIQRRGGDGGWWCGWRCSAARTSISRDRR